MKSLIFSLATSLTAAFSMSAFSLNEKNLNNADFSGELEEFYNYDIDMELSVNGKKQSSRIIILEDELGSITSETEGQKSFLEVVASEGELSGSKGILLKMKVGQINKDGSRTLISTPTVLAKDGEETSVIVGEDKNKEKIKIKVRATREVL